MANELDALLGVGDGKPADSPPEKPDADVKKLIADEVAKVHQSWKERFDEVNFSLKEKEQKLAELEKTVQPLKPQPVEPTNSFQTVEEWQKYIGETTNKVERKTLSEFDKIKQANWSKSVVRLAKARGYDLSTSEGKAKVQEIKDLALKIGVENEFDPDAISNALESAWAAKNSSQLIAQAELARRERAEAEITTNDLATSSSASSDRQSEPQTSATASDWKSYRIYQEAGGELDMNGFLQLAKRL